MLHLWFIFWGYIKISYKSIPSILLLGLLLCALFGFLERKSVLSFRAQGQKGFLAKLFLAFACALTLFLMFLNRQPGIAGVNWIPFGSYRDAFFGNNTELLLQCVMNILVYAVLGFVLPCCFACFEKIRVMLIFAFASSTCIEVLQWAFRIGYLEVDDVLNNVVGALLGVLLFKLVKACRVKLSTKK